MRTGSITLSKKLCWSMKSIVICFQVPAEMQKSWILEITRAGRESSFPDFKARSSVKKKKSKLCLIPYRQNKEASGKTTWTTYSSFKFKTIESMCVSGCQNPLFIRAVNFSKYRWVWYANIMAFLMSFLNFEMFSNWMRPTSFLLSYLQDFWQCIVLPVHLDLCHETQIRLTMGWTLFPAQIIWALHCSPSFQQTHMQERQNNRDNSLIK